MLVLLLFDVADKSGNQFWVSQHTLVANELELGPDFNHLLGFSALAATTVALSSPRSHMVGESPQTVVTSSIF